VNYTAANTGNVTGTVMAKIGVTGRVSVYVSYGNPDLIVDVQGYFQSGPPAAPPAPAVTSSVFPGNGWAASGTTGTLTASVSGVAGPAVRQYQWAIDDPTLSSPTVVTVATDNAAGTISLTGAAAPKDGWHTLYVRAVNTANNLSPVTAYTFGVGVAATSPATGTTVTRYVTLAGRAPASFASVTWNWRRAPADPWVAIPAGQVTNNGTTISAWPVTGSSDSSGFKAPTLVWDAATTLGTATLATPALVQACYTPTGGGAATCIADTAAPTITVDKLDLGNSDATTSLAGGSLDLLTGNLGLSATDASADAPGSDLTISRTFNTLDPTRATDPATSKPSVFGTGWTTALSVEAAGSDWTGLSDQGTTVGVAAGDGATVTFAKGTDGTYRPAGDDADSGLTLTAGTTGTYGPTSWTVADLDGNSTTFTPAATFTATPTPAAPHAYQVGSITAPGSNQTTTYSYNAAGYPTRMLAPTPAAGCGTWVPGCRALELGYDASNHLSDVTLHTTDAAGTSVSVKVACYTYTGGRLTSAWDPRDAATGGAGVGCTTPVRATSYGYDSTTGRLTSITPPGLAAWALGYDGTGRLTSVSRTHDAGHGGGTETTAVVYDLPTSKDATHPEYRPTLTGTDVATWGQGTAPVTATAIFGPGHPSSATDLRGATVSYLDGQGRTVNTADYAGTDATGWNIATTDYDEHGNVVRTLSAGNRGEALNPTGLADPRLNLSGDTAAAANALSTTNIYAYDSSGVGDLVDTFGPLHLVTVPGQATVVPARAHTHNTYDTGAETGHPAGGLLHLVTATTTGASLSPLPVATNETDQRTTTTAYALSSTDATGWTFRKPMKVTLDPAGLNISTITRYDPATGAVIETRQPMSSGSDAATTTTVYYTAGANPADAACGTKPAWDGLVCTVGPKAAPGVAGLPGLPTKRVTSYDYLGRPTVVAETVTDAAGTNQTRTTTTTYANSGYGTDLASTAITGGLGTAIPATATSYDPGSGLATKTTTGTASASTGYDDFGRVTAYTDNDQASGSQANTTTTSYDTAGRVATVADAHGTTSYTYNQNGETRDKPTTLTDSVLGTITGSYDPDGALATQQVTGASTTLTTTISTDEAGTTTSRRVEGNGRAWLTETQTPNIHGQVAGNDYAGAADYAGGYDYTYDAAGRLTRTADTVLGSGAATACTTRSYGFDTDSNRTSSASYSPGSGGACQTATATTSMTSTYDIADRLQPAGTHTGLVYDAFGRITTLPGADTGNKGAAATLSYHVNDLVRSITQNGLTQTFTLDATGRIGNWTTTGTGGGADKTNHYDDPTSDSPDWIAENATATTWTRNITGLDGTLVATTDQAGTLTWQVANIHGDITTTATATATEPTTYYKVDEYGQPTGAAPTRYGALGGKQRSTETPAGLTLMGVRLYTPTLGRFLTTDPITGGSASPYAYPTDPINTYDLNGQWWSWLNWKNAARAATVVGFGVCVFASAGACLAVGLAGAAISARANAGRWGGSRYWKSFGRDAAYAAVGFGYGKGLAKLYQATGNASYRSIRLGFGVGKRGPRWGIGRKWKPNWHYRTSYYVHNAQFSGVTTLYQNRGEF
jgi:RHS repeat-associated protein